MESCLRLPANGLQLCELDFLSEGVRRVTSPGNYNGLCPGVDGRKNLTLIAISNGDEYQVAIFVWTLSMIVVYLSKLGHLIV